MRHRPASGGTVLVMVLAAAGCGGGTEPVVAPPPVVQFNQSDVDFAIQMGRHHGQALEMTELARTRAKSTEVKALAVKIEKVQAPEVDQFATWLNTWGPAGATMPPHGMEDGDAGPGMLDPKQIDRLNRTSGRTFDRLFVALMIRHHGAAVAMASQELAEGENPDAKRLALSIQNTQASQTTEMRTLRDVLK